jgi:hypothetical protein
MLIRDSQQTKRRALRTRLEDLQPDDPNRLDGNSLRSVAFLFFTIVVFVLILGGLLVLNNPQKSTVTADPANEKADHQLLIDKVNELIDLPPEESPTIATVSDHTKLTDYSFFDDAENGDKVLIYTQSQKAIIYRPSTHRIVNSAPVSFEEIDPIL